jgi:perosamine synthetase
MSSPDLDERDVSAVAEVVRSGRLALGPKGEEFENRLAERSGVRHGVAVSSGTAALHLIVKTLGIGSGQEVLVPSFTFAASVNVLLYEGATPVFVDIESDTYNLAPGDLEAKITDRTKAIMVVDVFGHPAEWDAILAIAKAHGLMVIDDSCEALGAEYKGRPVGGFGDAAAFAFYPNKQITTGEGGVLVTDNDEIAGLARSLSNQGRGEMGAWVDHERLGYNYRMDEMSAALGLSQLARLDEFIAKRQRVADMYTERLREFTWLSPPTVRPHVRMSWFVYVVTLAEGLDRDPVMKAMEADGVPVRGYFRPVHLMPYIRERLGDRDFGLPVTDSVASRTIALPFHNGLTEEQVDRVVQALRRVGEEPG